MVRRGSSPTAAGTPWACNSAAASATSWAFAKFAEDLVELIMRGPATGDGVESGFIQIRVTDSALRPCH